MPARIRFLPAALLFVLLYGLVQLRWGERIPLTEGLGTYDGRRYGEIAKEFHREVFEDGLDLFRLQRILPSALVHLALRAVGSSFPTGDIVRAFLVLNVVLQMLLTLVWAGIARVVGLDERGAWLGWILLFFNFANLKLPFFYPVLTDTAALFLGAFIVYSHLKGRAMAMFVALLLAAFTWPVLFVSGSLLFACPREALDPTPPRVGLRVAATALAVIVLLVLSWQVLGLRAGGALGAASLAVLAVYTAAVTWTLFGSASLFHLRTYAAGTSWRRLALAAGAFVAIRIALLHASTAPGMTVSRHLRHVLLYNSGRPGLFLIAHGVYFGPVMLLLLLSWSRVAGIAHRLGLGITAYAVFYFLHGINAESRQLVDGLPVYVLLATLAVTERGLATGYVWLVAAVGLLASKFWLPINQGVWGEASRFPAQLYFMNMGPSMTSATLGLQAAGVLLTLALFWVALPRPVSANRSSAGRRPPVARL